LGALLTVGLPQPGDEKLYRCSWYYTNVKAKGCKMVPLYTEEKKMVDKRCSNAPPGGIYKGTTVQRSKSSITITNTN